MKNTNSEHMLWIKFTNTSYEITLMWMPRDIIFEVSIGSGNGLVPPGNKPLPEPMFTKIYVAIWRHYNTMTSHFIVWYHEQ